MNALAGECVSERLSCPNAKVKILKKEVILGWKRSK